MISLDTINAAFHSIKVSNGTYDLAIDSNGYLTIANSTFAATQSGTWNIGTVSTITNVVHVDDNSGSITVDASNLDIRDLTSASDSVEIKTAAGQALAINGSGYLTIANSSFAATQSGTWDIGTVTTLTSITNDVNIADGGNSITVDGTVAATQSGTWTIGTTEAGYSSWKVSKVAASQTEVEIASTPLANRLLINIQNRGANSVFLSTATGVDTDDYELPARSSVEWGLNATANIFCICDTGKTADLRVAEFAA